MPRLLVFFFPVFNQFLIRQPTSDRAKARAARILARAEALAAMRPTREESDALYAEWEKAVEADRAAQPIPH